MLAASKLKLACRPATVLAASGVAARWWSAGATLPQTQHQPAPLAPSAAPYIPRVEEQTHGDAWLGSSKEGFVLHGVGTMQTYAHPLVQYRSVYPDAMWQQLRALLAGSGSSLPAAVDVGVGTGRGALELAKRNFRVTSIEADSRLAARTGAAAAAQGIPLRMVSAAQEHRLLAPGSAQLVTFFHGLHLVDLPAALAESHRLLAPAGVLFVAWNDRDLSSPLVDELESLIEHYNPSYSRHLKQRGVEQWGEKLSEGGLFGLKDYSAYPNPVRLKNAAAVAELLDSMWFIRVMLLPERRAAFGAAARAIAEAHSGHGEVVLPLQTRAYTLRRIDTPSQGSV